MSSHADPLQTLLAAWHQIAAKVDAFFADVGAHHAPAMRCQRGCTRCCSDGLSVMPIEALALVLELEQLPAAERRRLAAATDEPHNACAFLAAGACRVYDARPLVCRSHGLPIRQQDEVAACELNFVAGAPSDAILDGGWLTATLTVVNGMLERQLGVAGLSRVALRELARRGRGALPEPLVRLLPPPPADA